MTEVNDMWKVVTIEVTEQTTFGNTITYQTWCAVVCCPAAAKKSGLLSLLVTKLIWNLAYLVSNQNIVLWLFLLVAMIKLLQVLRHRHWPFSHNPYWQTYKERHWGKLVTVTVILLHLLMADLAAWVSVAWFCKTWWLVQWSLDVFNLLTTSAGLADSRWLALTRIA